jgi:hypothetical protein
LVEIGSVVSEKKIFFFISSPLFFNFIEKRGDEIKKIFPSETTEPISTKLC